MVRRLVAVVLLVSLVGACSSGDDDDDTAPDPTTTSAQESTTTAPAEGCTGTAPEPGGPADEGEVVDLDGDGQRDTVWMASPANGGRELGVVTAAGGGDKVAVMSASPVAAVVLVADADETPPVELFVSDNRSVQLWAFDDCKLQQVVDAKGEPYLFDLGLTGYGTGVGCVDADDDDRRDLVGLNETGRDATTVEWSQTIIERDGLQASNGATVTGTYRIGEDDAAIELLHTVSCGDLEIDKDGIRQPEP